MIKSLPLRIFLLIFCASMALTGCRNEKNKIYPSCIDGVKNQDEIGIDCGGPCPECLPTCDDGVLNGEETRPDCGGPDCEECATCDDGEQNAHWLQHHDGTWYLKMEVGIDCGSPCPLACIPNCEDGLMNGDEDGVDCGGACPDNPPCPPICGDGMQNGLETGIDCGAPIGTPCSDDCPPATCDDGIQNVHIELNESAPNGFYAVIEAGIDCDYNTLTDCPDCPNPTCFDGVMNGLETGIDCGGLCGIACPEPTCADGIMNGEEEGVDCGGPNCAPCPTCDDGILNGPEFEEDCLDYALPPELLVFYPGYATCAICESCHDGVQGEFELLIDCGGPECEPCEQNISGEFDVPVSITDPDPAPLNVDYDTQTITTNYIAFPQGNITAVGTYTITLGDEEYTKTVTLKIPVTVEALDEILVQPFLGVGIPSVNYVDYDGTIFNSRIPTGSETPSNMMLLGVADVLNFNHVVGMFDKVYLEQFPPPAPPALPQQIVVTNLTFELNYEN